MLPNDTGEALSVAEAWSFEAIELRALEGEIDLVGVLKRRYQEPAKPADFPKSKNTLLCA